MLKRLLVAVPLAALATGGLFLAMRVLTDAAVEQPANAASSKPRMEEASSRHGQLPDGPPTPIVQPEHTHRCGGGVEWMELDIAVEKDGTVSEVRVVQAASECLVRTAQSAIRKWRYMPRVEDGRPVRSRVREVLRLRPYSPQPPSDHFFGTPAVNFGSVTPLVRPPPSYPPCGKGEGEVVLEFAVETDGRVGDVEVISATSACFAEAAKSEIVRWRYRPKVVNGEPVRSERMRVKLVFVEKR